ncbi:MAG: hypothetical protein DME40_14980 [Verrucomicrobia bacterium]|nr:MAG: hypothetical protein DME37_10125 [Verrucomicrobiota bacterium]PYK87196.1 MAG: hypothetical protein DME40_14980 [Verrucomicrobiota bacterium]
MKRVGASRNTQLLFLARNGDFQIVDLDKPRLGYLVSVRSKMIPPLPFQKGEDKGEGFSPPLD